MEATTSTSKGQKAKEPDGWACHQVNRHRCVVVLLLFTRGPLFRKPLQAADGAPEGLAAGMLPGRETSAGETWDVLNAARVGKEKWNDKLELGP